MFIVNKTSEPVRSVSHTPQSFTIRLVVKTIYCRFSLLQQNKHWQSSQRCLRSEAN